MYSYKGVECAIKYAVDKVTHCTAHPLALRCLCTVLPAAAFCTALLQAPPQLVPRLYCQVNAAICDRDTQLSSITEGSDCVVNETDAILPAGKQWCQYRPLCDFNLSFELHNTPTRVPHSHCPNQDTPLTHCSLHVLLEHCLLPRLCCCYSLSHCSPPIACRLQTAYTH